MKIGPAVFPGKIVVAMLGFIVLHFVSVVELSFVPMASGLDFM